MNRRALIFATSDYVDQQVANLVAPAVDAAGLRNVLGDPQIGNFDVMQCLDSSCQEWRRRIDQFFSKASRDDLLLLYVSGHAVKDREGKLYFVAADTQLDELLSTGIPASLIHEASYRSPSRRIVIILDTCFSGAFVKGYQVRAGSRAVNAADYFREGSGTVVIAASDEIQYALEGDTVSALGEPSIFTRHVIEGLRSGRADLNGDGWITTEELFEYVLARLLGETRSQRPHRWAFRVDPDIVIATNPVPRAPALPLHIVKLTQDPLAEIRLMALPQLERLLSARSHSVATAARESLEQMSRDESSAVAGAARSLLLVLPDALAGEALAAGQGGQPPVTPVQDIADRAPVVAPAPTTAGMPGSGGAAWQLADVGARAYAFMIDGIIRTLAAATWVLAGFLMGRGSGWDLKGLEFQLTFEAPGALIFLLYHPVLELVMQGCTPGKRFVGVRIVAQDGSAPSGAAVLIRNSLRLVDMLPVLYMTGLTCCMLTARRVRVGDILSNTCLVIDQGHGRTSVVRDSAGATASEMSALIQDLLARWTEMEVGRPEALARQLLIRLDPGVDRDKLKSEGATALRARLRAFLSLKNGRKPADPYGFEGM